MKLNNIVLTFFSLITLSVSAQDNLFKNYKKINLNRIYKFNLLKLTVIFNNIKISKLI